MNRPLVVLLVEDDPGDQLMIQEAMESVGGAREVHVVGDGREAWDYLQTESPRPDLILLDLNMPRMDGREFLTLLKSHIGLRHIPTVVLTTSNAQEDVIASYDSHANAYVVKPVDLDGMLAVVRRIDEFFTQTSRLSSSDT